MPRYRRGPDEPAPVPDFRDAETRASDKRLRGTWWRCPVHGLTNDATVLHAHAYCPDDGCTLRVKLVAWGRDEHSSRKWNWQEPARAAVAS